jgi:hypothetical protein
MLDRVERHSVRQIGQRRMNASLRRHRHLVILQIEVVDVLLHVPQKEVMRRPIFFAEPVRRNGLDLRQIRRIHRVPPYHCCQGVVAKFVVVAIVADRGGLRRIEFQAGLPELLEQRVLRRKTPFERVGRLRLSADQEGGEEEKNDEFAHSRSVARFGASRNMTAKAVRSTSFAARQSCSGSNNSLTPPATLRPWRRDASSPETPRWCSTPQRSRCRPKERNAARSTDPSGVAVDTTAIRTAITSG